ncbi:hypothetical protein BP5796_12375 [Coleophoma crateriformis]|uniref:Fungal N-terminal domain-containing protein n=1 Tax=Coleophoma crateriformis TaxID=565419 RepID=A0A3D8Q9C7_9HELO|nr:hypothetical protein BP5796_12375 [Coleophoma crateriformis]
MDAACAASALVGLIFNCATAIKTCNDLRGRYKNIPSTLSSIETETSTLLSSLYQLQHLMQRDPIALSSIWDAQSMLPQTFEKAIEGFRQMVSTLLHDLERIKPSSDIQVQWTFKLKFLWNEAPMQDLLSRIRAHQQSLQFLMSIINLGSLAAVRRGIEENQKLLRKIEKSTSQHKRKHTEPSKTNHGVDNENAVYEKSPVLISDTTTDYENDAEDELEPPAKRRSLSPDDEDGPSAPSCPARTRSGRIFKPTMVAATPSQHEQSQVFSKSNYTDSKDTGAKKYSPTPSTKETRRRSRGDRSARPQDGSHREFTPPIHPFGIRFSTESDHDSYQKNAAPIANPTIHYFHGYPTPTSSTSSPRSLNGRQPVSSRNSESARTSDKETFASSDSSKSYVASSQVNSPSHRKSHQRSCEVQTPLYTPKSQSSTYNNSDSATNTEQGAGSSLAEQFNGQTPQTDCGGTEPLQHTNAKPILEILSPTTSTSFTKFNNPLKADKPQLSYQSDFVEMETEVESIPSDQEAKAKQTLLKKPHAGKPVEMTQDMDTTAQQVPSPKQSIELLKQPQRQRAASRSKSSSTKTASIPKATEADARKYRIPPGYSLKNWDPSEEPILLLGSVFDANSLGKWIYDWTVYHRGPVNPISDLAGELWLLLIQLAGKVKRAEECSLHIRDQNNREIVEDFIESGERLSDKLKKLLKSCEKPMLQTGKNSIQLGKSAGTKFVDYIFGQDRQLENTEKFMASMRLWNLRFDANCADILRNPSI